ncbi:uncharacterized protein JN550_005559 [Neoarthrinium moseri]|uniref:uncharacterized protein n=1 Tax=Neoarthrinium moseri TaxID=1658444 RepID=UPI001FDCD965|nr:uncharacterized protein JN550_005559 [Neoarthrinium moseri]KAI1869969.1 hypothetical protein JN550_005559 [Neoarthrinium moseri]
MRAKAIASARIQTNQISFVVLVQCDPTTLALVLKFAPMDCCDKKAGVWLNHEGILINRSSTSSSATTTSTLTDSSTTSSTTSVTNPLTTTGPSGTSTASPQPANTDSSNDAVKVGAGVGVGLGVPLVALVSGISVLAFLKKRRRAQSSGDTAPPMDNSQAKYGYGPGSTTYTATQYGPNDPGHNMSQYAPSTTATHDASIPEYHNTVGNTTQRYDINTTNGPVELPGRNTAYEMQ